MSEHSTNERAEGLMGRRLTSKDEDSGVLPFDCPCELGYWCPVCQIDFDEALDWSEYNSFLWCPRCDRDYPSALCVPIHASPDPERDWVYAGPEAAIRIYLDTVEDVIARRAAR